MQVQVDDRHSVSALLQVPPELVAFLVMAHGAGAGMHTPSWRRSRLVSSRRIACLRFQFPYMQAGSKRPDHPALAHATVVAAVAAEHHALPDVPLFAGGKSFDGRMASQAQVEMALSGVLGLVFWGFPLHPAGKPSSDRAEHLNQMGVPLLFLQGTRDALAEVSHLTAVIAKLGKRATLQSVEEADHSFHMPARSGRRDADVLNDMLDCTSAWMHSVAGEAL